MDPLIKILLDDTRSFFVNNGKIDISRINLGAHALVEYAFTTVDGQGKQGDKGDGVITRLEFIRTADCINALASMITGNPNYEVNILPDKVISLLGNAIPEQGITKADMLKAVKFISEVTVKMDTGKHEGSKGKPDGFLDKEEIMQTKVPITPDLEKAYQNIFSPKERKDLPQTLRKADGDKDGSLSVKEAEKIFEKLGEISPPFASSVPDFVPNGRGA